ncbi:hypothetical protein ID853_03840 [Xenorhabdus sp. Vera]|uniref:hypothetical protein n=1 Tax=Xenorhabdus koppenhoeferi TaxID=351659 RepID=UPI0019BC82F5|nr:hypothetical protein [Xenorhabdus sp. Vera]MBD2810033.1 hypothetical protein [Xenorhabdus sp. Vera]
MERIHHINLLKTGVFIMNSYIKKYAIKVGFDLTESEIEVILKTGSHYFDKYLCKQQG